MIQSEQLDAQSQKNIYTSFMHKLDNGLQLTIEYLPEKRLLIIRGENINTQKDYLLCIKEQDLRNPNYQLTVEEFYLIIVESLSGYDKDVKTNISSGGDINVVINVGVGSKHQIKIEFPFKMEEQEVTLEFQVAKLYRKINQLQKEKVDIENLNKSGIVPVFAQNQTNLSQYTQPDRHTVVRNATTANTWYALFAEEPLKPLGIQTFKVKILTMVSQPTPQLYIGIAAKNEVTTLTKTKQAYSIYCNNGNVNNETVSTTYANYPSIHNEDIITVTVDMDLGLISFQLPSPFTNKKVKMTGFDKTKCYPYVELYQTTDSVQFVE